VVNKIRALNNQVVLSRIRIWGWEDKRNPNSKSTFVYNTSKIVLRSPSLNLKCTQNCIQKTVSSILTCSVVEKRTSIDY